MCGVVDTTVHGFSPVTILLDDEIFWAQKNMPCGTSKIILRSIWLLWCSIVIAEVLSRQVEVVSMIKSNVIITTQTERCWENFHGQTTCFLLLA